MVVRVEGEVPAATGAVDPLPTRTRPSVAFDWLNGDVPELRERYERCFRVDDRGLYHWQTLEADGRPIRLLIQQPAQPLGRDCALLYFHGGGWIVGSPATHADISRALCERTGLRVISVAYRLAPEHIAPAPVDDGLAALAHLVSAEARDQGCKRAILCGDSAGAAIALAVERRADASMRDRILGVCSLYGCFGLMETPSLRWWGSREQGLDSPCVERMWRLANAWGRPSPYSIEALAGPSPVPAYLLAASQDPLLDNSLALAAACRTHGRAVVLDLVGDEGHGFLHDVGTSARAAAAIARLARWTCGLEASGSERAGG